MAHDVIISHAPEDAEVAEAACVALEGQGISCWLAGRDLASGAPWSEAVVDAIGASKVMVLVFSHHTNRSPWIPREVERAVSRGVVVVPFRVEEATPSPALEFYLSTPHWLDAHTAPIEQHLGFLADTVRHIIDAPDTSAPRPEPGPAAARGPWWKRTPVLVAGAVVAVILVVLAQGGGSGGGGADDLTGTYELAAFESKTAAPTNALVMTELVKAGIDRKAVSGRLEVRAANDSVMTISVEDDGELIAGDQGGFLLVSAHGGARFEADDPFFSRPPGDAGVLHMTVRGTTFQRGGDAIVAIGRGGQPVDEEFVDLTGTWRQVNTVGEYGGDWRPTIEFLPGGRYRLVATRAVRGVFAAAAGRWSLEGSGQAYEGPFFREGTDLRLESTFESSTWNRL